jgi:DNA-binding CsgD family transcriptional regulator
MSPRYSKAKQAANQQKIVQGTVEGKTQSTIAVELGLTRETVNRNLAHLRKGFVSASREEFSAYVKQQVELLTKAIEEVWEGKLPPEAANSIRGLMDSIARLTGSNAPTKSISAHVQVGNEITQGFYVEFARRTMKLKRESSWQRLWEFIDSMPDDFADEDPLLVEGAANDDVH